jgi:hypothetical protein
LTGQGIPFGKKRLENSLHTDEELVLPETRSFEASMLNVEGKPKLALVLAWFDKVLQQILSSESKRKGISII